jgi:alpha-beta hydrolase superfamily lysophospholipase
VPTTPTLAPVSINVVTATPAATATGVLGYTRPTPAAPVETTITAADSTALKAAYYAPAVAEPVAGEGAPGVVLVHGREGSRADWDALARELQANGFAVLTLDLRGHGASPGPTNWDASVGDVAAAWRHLRARPEVDRARTALVGADVGANLALIVGANNADVAAVAALSPGDDYQGLRPAGLLPNFGARPVFLVASRDDDASYQAAQGMAPLLTTADTYYYLTAGHGAAMFVETDLSTRLLSWLAVKMGEAKG